MRYLLATILALFLSASAWGAWQGNGSNQDVGVTDNAALDFPDGSWTIAGWFNVNSNAGSGQNAFAGWGVISGTPSFNLYCREASATTPNAVQTNPEDNDGTNSSYASSTTPCSTTGTWFQITVIRTGTSEIRTYINGSSVGADTSITLMNAIQSADTWQFLNSGSNDGWFNGAVAEWAKWDRAISAGELATLQKYSPMCLSLASLTWYVPMIREYQELKAGLTVINNTTAAASHPPLIRCN